MILAYLLVVSGCFRTWKARGAAAQHSRWRKVVRLARGTIGMVAWVMTLFLGFGNPMFQDPTPSGPYSVGTARLYFSDVTRPDSFAPIPARPANCSWWPGIPRRLLQGFSPNVFWPDAPASAPRLAKLVHLPPFNFAQHLRLVQSHSHRNGRYPSAVPVPSPDLLARIRLHALAEHGADGRTCQPRLHRLQYRSHL